MKHIKVEELKKGIRFSKDVFFEDGQCLLLAAGNPLGDRELRALKTWQIPFVVTEGDLLNEEESVEDDSLEPLEEDFPEVEDITNTIYIEGSQLSDDNVETVSKMVVFNLPKELKESELYSQYNFIAEEVSKLFILIGESKELKEKAFSQVVTKMLNMAKEHPQETVMFVIAANVKDQDIALDSLSASLIVSLLCSSMDLDSSSKEYIVSASLLHKVGAMRHPSFQINKEKELTDAEIQILKTHISTAYKCAVQELLYPETVGKIILEQYERWDGKGYPNGISEANIEIGARIIAVADEFMSVLGKKAIRKPIMSYEAMKSLFSDSAHKFDPNVVKVMVQCIGVYPIGSIVLLNDGSVCKVMGTAPDAPLRPKVQIVLSETGKIPEEDKRLTIDLKTEKEKFIVRAVDPRVYLQ